MEKKKCSLNEHKEIDSKIFCFDCRIYMCNKCESFHSKLFPNHQVYNSDKDINDIFVGFCQEKNHPNKVEFFCKTHNQLCCGVCIAKIQKGEIGKHKDCDVCTIEEIKDVKKNKLEENIKYLNEISNNIQKRLEELKSIFTSIDEKKQEIKEKIQNVFTKLRNELNNREDDLLKNVDKTFDDTYFDEKIIKEGKNLPEKIKNLLEETENINNYNNEKQLSLFINFCIKVENNIKNINEINTNIQKCQNSEDKKIVFSPEDDTGINELISNIKKFGKLNTYDELKKSLIIKENEIELIKGFIGKKPKFKLLYRASIDGDTKKDFDKKCLNIQPTLAVVQNTLGNRFGGFTTQNWNYDKDSDKKDPNSFIFSLDNKEKYNLKDNNNRAIHTKSFVIYFGNADFFLNEHFLTKKAGWSNSGTRYFTAKWNDLSAEETFTVKEFEMYQVLF